MSDDAGSSSSNSSSNSTYFDDQDHTATHATVWLILAFALTPLAVLALDFFYRHRHRPAYPPAVVNKQIGVSSSGPDAHSTGDATTTELSVTRNSSLPREVHQGASIGRSAAGAISSYI